MKNQCLLIAALGFLTTGAVVSAGSPQSEPRVAVTFVEPEKFTDVSEDGYGSDRGREEVLASIKAHAEKTARYFIAEGEHLELRILDIDLAGDFEPWHGSNYDDIRILKEIYPPRMTVEFRLLNADGKVVSEGKRELSAHGYLMVMSFPSSDGLRYDKGMLGDWMRSEFRRKS